ncbi:unnamed protein product [Owenia fusiformis]|uniref:Uncharacterized protein n=1 Tax=Owenia fusiformis TaxID=6347 RepID=A0A8S4N5Y6_OWEFU|nr:unnamed protein product [Owenia fusiformis]
MQPVTQANTQMANQSSMQTDMQSAQDTNKKKLEGKQTHTNNKNVKGNGKKQGSNSSGGLAIEIFHDATSVKSTSVKETPCNPKKRPPNFTPPSIEKSRLEKKPNK